MGAYCPGVEVVTRCGDELPATRLQARGCSILGGARFRSGTFQQRFHVYRGSEGVPFDVIATLE